MKRLIHWMFDPQARTVRLALGEKAMAFESVDSPPWQPNREVRALAPGAQGVALIHRANEARYTAIGALAICEYLEEADQGIRLLPRLPEDRAEARRVWKLGGDLFQEACKTLLDERIKIAFNRAHTPDSVKLRTGAHAMRGALTFFNHLAEIRPFLAGRQLTLADLSVAAHLSCFDYFNDVPWETVPDLRAWYSRVKSRPSFRPLLSDTLEGTRPAAHYTDLDF
ncbi:MAG: glutathione S-transferase family protein [Hyphomonadaceae bacterium]